MSRVALGTWAFGGDWGSFDPGEAGAVIRRALDLGVTCFDTAQGYGFGVSERLLGEALRQHADRDEVVVATKGGLRMEGETLLRDSSPSWLRAGVESSLRDLRTDYIDLYQLHWPDAGTPFEETGAALYELIREGKIRHVGVSNFDPAQMDALSSAVPVEAMQPRTTCSAGRSRRRSCRTAEQHDMGVLIYGPLAHGLLSGRMTPETTFAADDWRAHSPDFTGETFARNLRVTERLQSHSRRAWA